MVDFMPIMRGPGQSLVFWPHPNIMIVIGMAQETKVVSGIHIAVFEILSCHSEVRECVRELLGGGVGSFKVQDSPR